MSVLKAKHSLLGKSLLPVIREMKGDTTPERLNRLKKEHLLERYSLGELKTDFFRLTGEPAESIFEILGSDISLEGLQRQVHFSIAEANLHGAPKGQLLTVTDDVPVLPSGSSSGSSTPASAGRSSAQGQTGSANTATGIICFHFVILR